MFDCEHQLQLSVFENDTNVILVLLSSAVSMTTSVVCTGLQLQECIFKNLAAHIANQYTVIAHVENSHRGCPVTYSKQRHPHMWHALFYFCASTTDAAAQQCS